MPAVYKPVKIDGRDYYDGGAHSSDNLDVIGADPYDLVVVSSPMSVDRVGDATATGQVLTASAGLGETNRSILPWCGCLGEFCIQLMLRGATKVNRAITQISR